MKSIPLLLAFAAVLGCSFFGIQHIGTKHSSPQKSITATFDGFEGGMYFFTNQDNQAITLTSNNVLPIDGIDLNDGDYVGQVFEIDVQGVEDVTSLQDQQVKKIRLSTP